jgi:hypothetical protein
MKLAVVLTLSWITRAAARCNPERDEVVIELESTAGGPKTAELVKLPQPKGEEATFPAALDGSPYAFYFRASPTNSTKWTINIQGGGWCYDEVDCLCRSQMSLGRSTGFEPTGGCQCKNPNKDGTIDTSCNCIDMLYLDGASFSGYRAEPVPVPGNASAHLWMRGIKNLDATLDWAFAKGMADATEFVLTGGSAGGLSTFLHADRFAGRLKKEAPKCAVVRAAPVVGFFLDHDNYKHTDGYPGGPNSPQWSTPGTGANYTMWMKYVYAMQNMTFGTDGGLTEACRAKHPSEPHLCFMSPHMADVIETPLFMFNSKFDAWQLANEFQSSWPDTPSQNGVLQYGADFMTELTAAGIGSAGSKHGGMITSCICHGCPWSDLVLDGKTSAEHFADWFYGATAGGAASLHVDPRSPNGGGALSQSDPRFGSCKAFPDPAAQPNPKACPATSYCCPDAKHCLTPTATSCAKVRCSFLLFASLFLLFAPF